MTYDQDISEFFEDGLLNRISLIIKNKDDDFVKLTSIAGLNPKVDFRGRDICGIDFGISDLTSFNFSECRIDRCNFSGATTRSSNFSNSTISNSKLNKKQSDSILSRASSMDNIEILEHEYSIIVHRLVQMLGNDKRFVEIPYRSKLEIVNDVVKKSLIENKLGLKIEIGKDQISDFSLKLIKNNIDLYWSIQKDGKIRKQKPIDVFRINS